MEKTFDQKVKDALLEPQTGAIDFIFKKSLHPFYLEKLEFKPSDIKEENMEKDWKTANRFIDCSWCRAKDVFEVSVGENGVKTCPKCGMKTRIEITLCANAMERVE